MTLANGRCPYLKASGFWVPVSKSTCTKHTHERPPPHTHAHAQRDARPPRRTQHGRVQGVRIARGHTWCARARLHSRRAVLPPCARDSTLGLGRAHSRAETKVKAQAKD
eukprot:6018899-Pleurochrysis_carterae.AAC.2